MVKIRAIPATNQLLLAGTTTSAAEAIFAGGDGEVEIELYEHQVLIQQYDKPPFG